MALRPNDKGTVILLPMESESLPMKIDEKIIKQELINRVHDKMEAGTRGATFPLKKLRAKPL